MNFRKYSRINFQFVHSHARLIFKPGEVGIGLRAVLGSIVYFHIIFVYGLLNGILLRSRYEYRA